MCMHLCKYIYKIPQKILSDPFHNYKEQTSIQMIRNCAGKDCLDICNCQDFVNIDDSFEWSDRPLGGKSLGSRNDKPFAITRQFLRLQTSEPIPAKKIPGEEPWTRGALGRKAGYDRKSLPRRNWLYKIGSAAGSYTCLLRMQTSSPNACKPHESTLLESRRGPNVWRTVPTDTRAVLSIAAEISPVPLVFADARVHCPSF